MTIRAYAFLLTSVSADNLTLVSLFLFRNHSSISPSVWFSVGNKILFYFTTLFHFLQKNYNENIFGPEFARKNVETKPTERTYWFDFLFLPFALTWNNNNRTGKLWHTKCVTSLLRRTLGACKRLFLSVRHLSRKFHVAITHFLTISSMRCAFSFCLFTSSWCSDKINFECFFLLVSVNVTTSSKVCKMCSKCVFSVNTT